MNDRKDDFLNITNRLYFRSSLALALLCYQMGMPSHALAAYGTLGENMNWLS